MLQRTSAGFRTRPRLRERLLLRLCDSGRVDGLWVGFFPGKQFDFQRVEEALGLIKAYDRARYNRLIRDLERVLVIPVSGYVAEFNSAIGACTLDSRFVRTQTLEMIASSIVHEATHARLIRCGIGYEEQERARVEAVCIRRELAFAEKLPNGQQLRESKARNLELCASPGLLSNWSMSRWRSIGMVQVFYDLGYPLWLVRILVTLFILRLRLRSYIRGLVVPPRS